MCSVDYAELVTMLTNKKTVARKEHRCNECGRNIVRGETYLYESYVHDGSLDTHKTCLHCLRVRDWLYQECGGAVFGDVREEIIDHYREGHGIKLARLAVGMRRKWINSKGAQMPIPSIALPAHQTATQP